MLGHIYSNAKLVNFCAGSIVRRIISQRYPVVRTPVLGLHGVNSEPGQASIREWPRTGYPLIRHGLHRANGKCHNSGMNIDEWWPQLDDFTRHWLIDHNGEAIPPAVAQAIADAGGTVTSGSLWVGAIGPSGVWVSDEASDWIEAIANDETPESD